MYESEKKVKVTQSCLTLRSHGLYSPWNSPGQKLEWVAFPFSRGSSQPGDRTQVSRIAGGFFTSWATREAQNTGVGSLSLLQQIFLTQKSNQGLLHCRWILYQLNYEGSLKCLTVCLIISGFLDSRNLVIVLPLFHALVSAIQLVSGNSLPVIIQSSSPK